MTTETKVEYPTIHRPLSEASKVMQRMLEDVERRGVEVTVFEQLKMVEDAERAILRMRTALNSTISHGDNYRVYRAGKNGQNGSEDKNAV